jgi:dTDP-4-dehydrorhamnose 3,5-epimerase
MSQAIDLSTVLPSCWYDMRVKLLTEVVVGLIAALATDKVEDYVTKVHTTSLDGVLVIEPRVHRDERGFFVESYSARTLQEFGIATSFLQDNHSRSVKGTLRGLHYQAGVGQVKLVRVISGAIFDVAVDIRWESPTFGKWFGQILSAENFLQLYIPVGFAHGFCVLTDAAEVVYKCSSYYSPADERGLAWNDPTVAVEWPVQDPLLSARDQRHPLLHEIDRDFTWQGTLPQDTSLVVGP